MHTILGYDCGKLKVLIFGVDEDEKLQVKLNDWIICSTYTSFSLYESVADNIQEVVSQFIYTTRWDLFSVEIMDEIFHRDGPYE
jgi:hypothetical protein